MPSAVVCAQLACCNCGWMLYHKPHVAPEERAYWCVNEKCYHFMRVMAPKPGQLRVEMEEVNGSES